MRLSKTSRWILVIGILTILLVTLAVLYFREQDQQSTLRADISQAQESLVQLTARNETDYEARKQDLQARLDEAQATTERLRSRFYDYDESIEINEAVFSTAEEAGVTISSLTSSTPGKEERNGVTYRVFNLGVTATAVKFPSLISFSQKLPGTFDTVDLQTVDVGIKEDVASMDIALKVYFLEQESVARSA